MTALRGTVVVACGVLEVVAAVLVIIGMAVQARWVVVLALVPAAAGVAPIVDEATGVSRGIAALLMALRASLVGGDRR